MKYPKKVSQGKKNREAGARFERKVRKDLESKGWIVDRWSNNVEFDYWNNLKIVSVENKDKLNKVEKVGRLIPAKRKYNPFKKVMAIGTGFPDFIAFRFMKKEREVLSAKGIFTPYSIKETESVSKIKLLYEVIGVEVKSNGYLTKEEKEKCEWLLDNKLFSKILVASKGKKRGEIIYNEIN